MKIMVFDVPAEVGGALTILNQYYHVALQDQQNQWYFIVSTPKLLEQKNVRVLNYPWVKKSWFHRLYFDYFISSKLIKEFQIDEVLSLQNTIIPFTNKKQTLYLHQSLPFVETHFGFLENFKFWMYQNVISKMIFQSIRKADQVIVQTKWMIEAAAKKTGSEREKFILQPPTLNIQIKEKYTDQKHENIQFFYPASAFSYKNHRLIIEACKLLKNDRIDYGRVIVTLTGEENNEAKKLKAIVQQENLNIDFVGMITIDQVYEYYSRSVLLFPSYIETFGLPLLEAKMHEAPILASDCAFSHEILDGYEHVRYFDPHQAADLYEKMTDFLKTQS